MKLRELREKKGALATELRDLLNKSEAEKRSLNETEETRAQEIENELRTLETEIRNEEKLQERKLLVAAGSTSANSKDHLSESEERDFSKYSYANVLRMQLPNNKREGLEHELHQEAVQEMRDSGVSYNGTGVLIPSRLINIGTQKRAHSAGTTTEGGYMVQTDKQEVIPYLNANPIVASLGAQVMTGLTGNVSFPRNDNSIEMGWKTEASAADEKSITFEELLLTPKELTGYGVVSKTLMAQTGGVANRFIQDEFSKALQRAFDKASIQGTGSSGQPTGILNTSGIGSVVGGTNGATPDWADIVNLVKEVAQDNALNGRLSYLTTPGIKALLSQTPKQSSGVEGSFILTNPYNELYGYNFAVSNQVPSNLTKGTSSGVCHAIIFGNFEELMLAMWGGMEILVNPYSLDTTRQIRITASLWGDIGVRHAASFAAMKDATLS